MGATQAILAGANAVSGFASQQQQARALTSQAGFDSTLAGLQAKDAVARGELAANQRGVQTRRTIGAQRAASAASGIDANSGSAVDLQGQEASFGALDETMIRNNAAREAWGYTTQANLNSVAAQNEAASLKAQSYGTLLTGAVKSYGLYQGRQKNTLDLTDPHATQGSTGGTRAPAQPYGSDVAKLGLRRYDRTTRS